MTDAGRVAPVATLGGRVSGALRWIASPATQAAARSAIMMMRTLGEAPGRCPTIMACLPWVERDAAQRIWEARRPMRRALRS